MTALQAIILAIVEGITEFLPISSTGHLILTADILHIPTSSFLTTFEIAIQSGAVLAILFYYGRKIKKLLPLWDKVLIAFIPTAVVGFLLYPVIKGFLLQHVIITAISLISGGIFFLVFEKFINPKLLQNSNPKITAKKAFIVGCFQSLAIIPGVSRSAATIIIGMIQGVSKKEAVEFSFLLSIPTLGLATLYDLKKTAFNFTLNEYTLLLIGIIGACISSLITIRWFLKFVEKHSFFAFGVYRIIAGLLFLLFIVF